MKILLIIAKHFIKIETFPVVRLFTWKPGLVSNILWLIVENDKIDESEGIDVNKSGQENVIFVIIGIY